MSTLIENLRAEIVRLEAKHGSDNKFVKDLKEQLRASEATSGMTAQEVFRMQAFDFSPKLWPQPTSAQEMQDEAISNRGKPGKPPERKLPNPPKRDDFQTQVEYEEALGGWQSRVGRIKGIAGVKS